MSKTLWERFYPRPATAILLVLQRGKRERDLRPAAGVDQIHPSQPLNASQPVHDGVPVAIQRAGGLNRGAGRETVAPTPVVTHEYSDGFQEVNRGPDGMESAANRFTDPVRRLLGHSQQSTGRCPAGR